MSDPKTVPGLPDGHPFNAMLAKLSDHFSHAGIPQRRDVLKMATDDALAALEKKEAARKADELKAKRTVRAGDWVLIAINDAREMILAAVDLPSRGPLSEGVPEGHPADAHLYEATFDEVSKEVEGIFEAALRDTRKGWGPPW